MKSTIYLAVASHWSVPGVRQYASTERALAERKCVELVNELRDDMARELSGNMRDPCAPPPVQGGDWESTLRALQLTRLIDVEGGEGEANDVLFAFCERTGRDEPPLVGEGFPPTLQEIIADLVAEDDKEGDDKIGFPMVWIEEVEAITTPVEPAADLGADLALVLDMAERFANEGAIADGPSVIVEPHEDGSATFKPTDWFAAAALDKGDRTVPAEGVAEARAWLRDAGCTLSDEQPEQVAVLAAISRLRAQPPTKAEPITVAVSVSGGVLQWGGADREGVRLIVIDYDQDGTPHGELVDMAEPDDTREAYASVYEEGVEINAEAIARILEKRDERELRETRYNANQCIECGVDLDSPSAAGAEEGVCGSCIGGDE